MNQSRLSVYVISPQFTEEILRHCPTQWRHRVWSWSWFYLKTGAKLQNNPLHLRINAIDNGKTCVLLDIDSYSSHRVEGRCNC